MEASLMFYQKLVKDLVSVGFTINPYDPCVANKTIKGSQFTVVWHVDDMKLSHKDPKVVESMVKFLQKKYEQLQNGEIKKMEIQRDNKLDYLGMQFDMSNKGEVKITMKHHVMIVLSEFPDPFRNKKLSSPNTDNLFTVRDDQ